MPGRKIPRMALAAWATEAALLPAVGAVVGVYFDRKFGWSPWGAVGGFTVGGFGSFRILRDLMRRMENDD